MAENKWLDFSENSESWRIISEWWKELSKDRGAESEDEPRKQDRAGRAELRRRKDIPSVIFVPAYQRLRVALLDENYSFSDDGLAAIAGLLAQVETDAPDKPFAAQMAEKKPDSDKPKLSELRFRRLLKLDNRRELYRPLIRVIHHLNRTANIRNLAESVIFWSEKTRKWWANDYYRAALKSGEQNQSKKGEQQ